MRKCVFPTLTGVEPKQRSLHSRDLQKVAAFSISTKTLAAAVGRALHGAGTETAYDAVDCGRQAEKGESELYCRRNVI